MGCYNKLAGNTKLDSLPFIADNFVLYVIRD